MDNSVVDIEDLVGPVDVEVPILKACSDMPKSKVFSQEFFEKSRQGLFGMFRYRKFSLLQAHSHLMSTIDSFSLEDTSEMVNNLLNSEIISKIVPEGGFLSFL